MSLLVVLSGSAKINTFYLSVPTLKIDGFKRSYITRYVVPFILVITTVLTVVMAVMVYWLELYCLSIFLAYDRSSVFFSRDYQLPALLGEYMIGRLVMLVGLFVCLKLGWINGLILLALFGVQFLTMLIWFVPFEKKLKSGTEEVTVPLKKNMGLSAVGYCAVNYKLFSNYFTIYFWRGNFQQALLALLHS